ncbi:hypothetical protein B0H13DRAFT_2045851 [Mycena leptocephala]|nr:hypothetical protein B0H13DRAFT_2045851 [Mycena leptocephala]
MHVSTRPDTFTSRSAQASSRTRPARGVYRRPQSHTHRPQRDIQRPWIAVRGRKANLRAMFKSPTLPPLSRTVTLHAPKRMVSTSRSQRTPHAHAFQPENRAETNAHSPPHPRSQPTPATACPEDAQDIRPIPVKVRVGAYWAPNPPSLKRSTWQDERDGGEVKSGMRREGGRVICKGSRAKEGMSPAKSEGITSHACEGSKSLDAIQLLLPSPPNTPTVKPAAA